MADAATIKMIEDRIKILQSAKDCQTLLKKYLTEDVVGKLKGRKTKLGATLLDVIQSAESFGGVHGVLAPNAEVYTTFKELFDPIIRDYGGFKPTDRQPAIDWGESRVAELKDLDPEKKFIQSTRIRCGRSLAGFPFNPCLTEANYKEIEGKETKIFENIPDPELQGTYYPLSKSRRPPSGTDPARFDETNRFLQAANACRYWPTGRGIFHNKDKTFLAKVNEEDHLRIISMQPGGDVGKVLAPLIRGVKIIEKHAPFSRDDRLGWLTFCPTNLGTTVRASVHIKIPKALDAPGFEKRCADLMLDIRGIHGEHSETSWGGTCDLSNKARLGLTEFEAVKAMYDGADRTGDERVNRLIE